jgi:hypothetical protein
LQGWYSSCIYFADALPHVKFILPTGALFLLFKFSARRQSLLAVCFLAPIQPVTINGGRSCTSWHDIRSLDKIDDDEFKVGSGFSLILLSFGFNFVFVLLLLLLHPFNRVFQTQRRLLKA